MELPLLVLKDDLHPLVSEPLHRFDGHGAVWRESSNARAGLKFFELHRSFLIAG
jgi:hypothetical protein